MIFDSKHGSLDGLQWAMLVLNHPLPPLEIAEAGGGGVR